MPSKKFRQPLRSRLAGFARNQRGTISVMTACTMVPFIIAAGTALDMARANRTFAHMQKAVDTAALAAAATQLPVTVADADPLTGDEAKIYVANNMVEANLPQEIKATAEAPVVTIDVDKVTVDLDAEMPTAFMSFVGIDLVDLSVTATAYAKVDAHGCFVALGSDGDGIQVGGSVDLEVTGCWLYSNKEGAKSIDIIGTATVDAPGSRSVGLTSVSNQATVYDRRYSNANPIEDPLGDWTHPSIPGTCDYTNFKQQATTVKTIELTAGVYCGGLEVNGYDVVTLLPGIYYITDGPLTINAKVDLSGEGVGFYLANDVTAVTINGTANVSLTAIDDEDSEMDGMLFAQEPGAAGLISARINGTSDLYMEGTIYLKSAELEISGTSATKSSAMQIIADSIELTGTSSMSFEAQLGEDGKPVGGEFASLIRLIK